MGYSLPKPDNESHYPSQNHNAPTNMMFDKLTALVADDQELMRSVTANQLRGMGWSKVLTAKNGAEALRQLRAQRVDVLLTDWNMPVMGGLELLRAVRGDAKLARLPVLMVTSEVERSRIQDVIAAGVSGLLVKPFNASVLRARLERLLSTDTKATPKPAPRTRRPDAAETDPDAPESQFMLPASHILVVDDNPTTLALISRLFKDDYDVSAAPEGREALRICRSQHPPDLVLIDVQMPGMDGFETVAHLRDTPHMANIPVIFVTSDTSDSTRRRGMELGAVDFVTKATPPRELRQRVANFLRFVELRKQLQSDYDAMLENARLREEVENMTRHDLKGSLSGIVGMVRNLATDDDMPQRYMDKLRLVQETAEQALTSVNLGGDMYKIETGRYKLDVQPVRIGDVLRRIVEVSRASFAEKDLSIVVDADVPVGQELPQAQGDATLCHSLFQNLIKNACEAAPRKSKVHVILKDENPLRILIQNKGVVPRDIRDVFFDKFVTQNKSSGSGLGTYSARLLAVAQHGSIDMACDDALNETTVTVWLPRCALQLADKPVADNSVPNP